MHHSKQYDEAFEHVRKMVAKRDMQQRLGETGQFPQGKLTEQDEGEIVFAVTGFKGKVVLNFGHSVNWVGFTPAQARSLAALLFKRANEIEMDDSRWAEAESEEEWQARQNKPAS